MSSIAAPAANDKYATGTRLQASRADVRPSTLGRYAVVVLLATTVPSVLGFSYALPLGGGSLYFTDILLPVAALATLPVVIRVRGAWLPFVLASFCVLGVLDGLYHGASFRWVERDVRAPIYMALGASVGLYVVRDRRNWNWYLSALTWLLGVVAVLDILSQVTPRALIGASGDDVLYYGATAIDLSSRRAQLPTDPIALIVLGGIVGAAVAGVSVSEVIGRRRAVLLFVSCATILFLADARNTLLGLAVACLIGLIAPVGVGRSPAVAAKIAGLARAASRSAAIVAAMAFPVAVVLFSGIAAKQISTYDTRVLQGLSSRAISTDSSVLWRETEDRLAYRAIRAHTVIGDGIGSFYRPHVTDEPFIGDEGRVYVHDYYLWLAVRGGIVGMIIFAFLYGGALLRLIYHGAADPVERGTRVILGCGLAAILAVAVVAPFPEETSGASILGLLLAVAWSTFPGRLGVTQQAPGEDPPRRDQQSHTGRPVGLPLSSRV